MGIPSMKLQTEKPYEQVMRFFTPELFLRFNSSSDKVADRADIDWEEAIQNYRRHLDRLKDRLPAEVKELSELCLHDSELLDCETSSRPIRAFPVEEFGSEILALKQREKVVILRYELAAGVRESQPNDDWPFSKSRTHWLYDEVDVAPSSSGTFLHRILFSDGKVIEIPFVSVWTHSVFLQREDEHLTPRPSSPARPRRGSA